MTSARYDVIIIGTGAGGGTLLSELAQDPKLSGKRILVLERGEFVRREPENWSTRAVNVEARYHTKEVWRDRDGRKLRPHTNYCVGGNTKFYGAALFRMRLHRAARRHAAGRRATPRPPCPRRLREALPPPAVPLLRRAQGPATTW